MSRWNSALLAALALFVLVGGLQAGGALEPFERRTLDARMRLLRDPAAFHKDIVFVSVGQYSLTWFYRQEKHGWPWPRDLWTYLIDYCAEGGAKLVIFDIGFTESGPGDEALAESIARCGRYIQATPFTDDGKEDTGAPPEFVERCAAPADLPGREVRAIVKPVDAVWRAAKRCVPARTYPDSDGANRRYPIALRYRGRAYPSMALAAAAEALGTWKIDAPGEMLLLYDAVDREVPHYECADVISSASLREQGRAHSIPPEVFKDKIVFVSAWAPGLLDLKVTPLSEVEPGVMVHATALSNILQRRFLTRLPRPASLALLAVVIVGVCVATRFLSARAGAIAAVAALALCVGGALLAFRARVWADVVPAGAAVPLAFGVVSAMNYVTEGRQRLRVKRTFQRYVSAQVVEKILDRPLALEGERKELTILFLDFQGFTEMSERLEPVELVKLINEYHNEAVEAIFAQQGTVDKFIGDAIMAFWNDPLPQPDHAARACLACVEIRERLGRLSARMRESGMPEMRARIGINTGVAVAGNMGSKLQFNYTAMGDAVNLASRLEGVNKEFGTDILVSEATLGGAREGLEVREVALIAVKGKHQPVRIFEVLGRKGEVPEDRLRWARRFEEGLAHFRERRWDEAAKRFDGVDRASRVYAGLCVRYRSEPPADGWGGVYVMEHK